MQANSKPRSEREFHGFVLRWNLLARINQVMKNNIDPPCIVDVEEKHDE